MHARGSDGREQLHRTHSDASPAVTPHQPSPGTGQQALGGALFFALIPLAVAPWQWRHAYSLHGTCAQAT